MRSGGESPPPLVRRRGASQVTDRRSTHTPVIGHTPVIHTIGHRSYAGHTLVSLWGPLLEGHTIRRRFSRLVSGVSVAFTFAYMGRLKEKVAPWCR